jgi:lysophospholipase L1-like esterase
VGGDTSVDGLNYIPTALGLYPDARRYLLQYGTNDARPWAPVPSGKGLNPGDPGYPGTYKDNMQQIIDAINNAGQEVCLAKIPIALGDTVNSVPYVDPDTGARSVLIKEYNEVIDEFENDPSNDITVTPPSFYNFFKEIDPGTGNPRYEDQYADNLHPNGIGYQSMAGLWFDALTQ